MQAREQAREVVVEEDKEEGEGDLKEGARCVYGGLYYMR